MTPTHDIHLFHWCKGMNSFFSNDTDLIATGRQFYITNPVTGGFRRFRLHRELVLHDGTTYRKFRSEDLINCIVKLKNNRS